MDFFDEVDKEKLDFPQIKNLSLNIEKNKFNFYQYFSFILFFIAIIFGVVFGNMFATCKTSSYFYSNSCLVTEFNFSLMILIWFLGLFVSICFYSVGHIISLLSNINEKLSKF